MGDVRDPERDQSLPKPGKLPVQQILMKAISERAEYGKRKYGTVLMTDNGRDALIDLWEELLDGLTYLTQLRLERGDTLPGMDKESDSLWSWGETDPVRRGLPEEPHRPGECGETTPGLPVNRMCCTPETEHAQSVETAICTACPHPVHPGGFCDVRRVDGLCPCEVGPRRRP